MSFFPEHTRDIAPDLINRAVESRESGEYDQIFIRADGETRIFHSTFEGEYGPDGEVNRIIGTVQDVTERKLAEDKLRASEARIQSIFRAAPTGIGMTINRNIQKVNERLCEMTGYSADELIGQNSRILYLSDADFEYVGEEKYRQIQLSGTGTVEVKWRRKDGEVIDVLLGSTPLEQDDLTKGVTFTALDITERIASEETRLSLERQVQQSQKLESLGVLAGGIAHDFNNLLMSILGNADLALLDLPDTSPARESITAVTTAAQRAAGLARQMLAYSGKGKFVIEPIEINTIVQEMAGLLEVSISKKTNLSYDFQEDIPCFDGDVNQIRQVIMNLITNASDALGDDVGTIELSTGKLECTKEYLGTAENFIKGVGDAPLTEGEYVFFEVSDTGPGMDEITKAKIFEPFFTTKFTGRGLGLAAVLGIINSHGGAIQVYSEPGHGTIFKVLLPVATSSALPVQCRKTPDADSNWHGSGLVLIADDDDSVRRVSEQMYKRMGFSAILASDGKQAVDTFRLHAEQLVMVQLDLTMPEMGGEEAFGEMRVIKPEIRVLLSSGYNQQEATQQFNDEGLAGFIQKPFTFQELNNAVRMVFEQGQKTQEEK